VLSRISMWGRLEHVFKRCEYSHPMEAPDMGQ
jgi:hypothetical protein